MTDRIDEETGEVLEGSVEAIDSGTLALGAVERANIDMQIATAKQYPRSIDESLKEALSLATMDEDIAGSMFYVLPRGGKRIEGKSVRLAEVMAYTWKNLRIDAKVVAENATHVTAQGTCFDLERNVAHRAEVRRRITNKSGVRYNDDMIVMTGNAAAKIALRNVIFTAIPDSLVQSVYKAARQASLGKGGTIVQKRQKAMAWLEKIGVTEKEVFAVLDVHGWDDIMEEELITLRGIATAIKDGDSNVEDIFRPVRTSKSDAGDELRKAAGDQEGEGDGKPPSATDKAPASGAAPSSSADPIVSEETKTTRESAPATSTKNESTSEKAPSSPSTPGTKEAGPPSAPTAPQSDSSPSTGPPLPDEPPPSPADQFKSYMAKATQYKAALGDEDAYREIIGRYVTSGPVKPNNVPAESYADCLKALADAVGEKDGPSAESFASLAEMKKPQVLETIRQLEEQVLNLGIPQRVDLRSQYGVQGKIDKATMDVLKPYAAHLLDRAAGAEEEVQV